VFVCTIALILVSIITIIKAHAKHVLVSLKIVDAVGGSPSSLLSACRSLRTNKLSQRANSRKRRKEELAVTKAAAFSLVTQSRSTRHLMRFSLLSLRARRITCGTKSNGQHRTWTKDWVARRREVSKNWKAARAPRDEISYSMQLQEPQIDRLTIQLEAQALPHGV
jgi:hypothetical protein